MYKSFTLSLCLMLLAATTAVAQGAPPSDTVTYVSGSLTLRGVVYRPVGGDLHPAVLYLHGSGEEYDKQAAAIGALYASRGYVLFFPYRRGQGLSAGHGEAIVHRLDREVAERGPEVRAPLLARLLESEQLNDVRAALNYLRGRADVDSSRVAVAGNSFGGILTVFAAAWAPGVKAAIASAPAAQSWAGAPELRARMSAAVRAALVPVFFLQAANDYDLSPSSALPAAMDSAGRAHKVRVYPPFGTSVQDGHAFGYYGGEIYGPDVFAFLAASLGPGRSQDRHASQPR